MTKSKILTGANAVIKLNGKTLAIAKNISYPTCEVIEPEVKAFLDLLARTGNAPAADRLARAFPGLKALGTLDLKLDGQGDMIIASGIEDIKETIKQKLLTPVGELNKHPDFGLGLDNGKDE